MGKSTPKAPAAPDPVATAAAQTASNKETAAAEAKLNRINQYTPYGSQTYTATNESIPTYTQTVTLSPEQQRLYDLETASQRKMGEIAGDQLARLKTSLSAPISYEGMPEFKYAIPDTASDVSRVRDALMSRINPQLDQERNKLEQRLASQGIGIGSEAYQSAMRDFGQQSNDMLMQAELQAGQEQTRLANMYNTQNAAQNAARQQAIAEAAALRNQPLNEISALMSGSQVQSPSFTNIPNVGMAGTDVIGAYRDSYNAQMDKYKTDMSNRNAMLGGLASLGGTAISAGFGEGGFFR